jgi:hypothetical protein
MTISTFSKSRYDCKEIKQNSIILDDWLTVHHSITLVDFQLDAQNSYLFLYNTFIKLIYMFRVLPCSSSGGLRRSCSFSTGAQDSHLQRVTIPKAAYIQLRRRPPEDEQGNVRNT